MFEGDDPGIRYVPQISIVVGFAGGRRRLRDLR